MLSFPVLSQASVQQEVCVGVEYHVCLQYFFLDTAFVFKLIYFAFFLTSFKSTAVTWSVYPTFSNEILEKASFSFWLPMHPNFITAKCEIGLNITDRVK